MKTSKVLNLNGNRFVMPDGMPAKEIQALVGFLALFNCVGQEYDYTAGEYVSYVSGGVSIQLETVELGDKGEVKAACAKTYEEFKAKDKAKKEALEA